MQSPDVRPTPSQHDGGVNSTNSVNINTSSPPKISPIPRDVPTTHGFPPGTPVISSGPEAVQVRRGLPPLTPAISSIPQDVSFTDRPSPAQSSSDANISPRGASADASALPAAQNNQPTTPDKQVPTPPATDTKPTTDGSQQPKAGTPVYSVDGLVNDWEPTIQRTTVNPAPVEETPAAAGKLDPGREKATTASAKAAQPPAADATSPKSDDKQVKNNGQTPTEPTKPPAADATSPKSDDKQVKNDGQTPIEPTKPPAADATSPKSDDKQVKNDGQTPIEPTKPPAADATSPKSDDKQVKVVDSGKPDPGRANEIGRPSVSEKDNMGDIATPSSVAANAEPPTVPSEEVVRSSVDVPSQRTIFDNGETGSPTPGQPSTEEYTDQRPLLDDFDDNWFGSVSPATPDTLDTSNDRSPARADNSLNGESGKPAEWITIPPEQGKAAYEAWLDSLYGTENPELERIDAYIYGLEPKGGDASEEDVAAFREWLGSVAPAERNGMEALKAEIGQSAEQRDAEVLSQIADFPEPALLQGTLPPDQAALVTTPYALGIRQNGDDTIGEAIENFNTRGSIAPRVGPVITPVSLSGQFMVTDHTDPLASTTVMRGFWGHGGGRYVVAIPINGASPEETANPAQYAGYRETLPDDFTLEDRDWGVNPKYIAVFIDRNNRCYRNTEFMQSDRFVPDTQAGLESDWID